MSTAVPDSDLQLAVSPLHHHVVSTAANNPRKKRSKVIRFDNPKRTKSSPSPNGALSARKRDNRPEITMPCTECGKRFWSWKALFGHMRCHPERQWRGINPPPNLLRGRSDLALIGSLATVFSEEENDVAASLLLLANGRPKSAETLEDQEVGDHIHDHDQYGHGGFRFESSSCKKVFGSWQALVGQRSSHKNVKGCFANGAVIVSEAEKKVFAVELGSGSHKCGICLRIFSSGQALGGHKRCHWEKLGISDDPPLLGLSQALNHSLDLNLPAPLEDDTFSSSSGMALDLTLAL
ncbi:Zinc finger protein ZAT3 [Morus notabilis]|uniref:Zinc finger protein ZAT3 n=1 Tax=Morus notabilis TaxID=981085 RepID=W9QYZ6_9ROSA|nr:zinc finger protein ZAT3 [Morus notabilis]EXB51458.1 Zinc finger protein ZAT3 [Morus notabilis]